MGNAESKESIQHYLTDMVFKHRCWATTGKKGRGENSKEEQGQRQQKLSWKGLCVFIHSLKNKSLYVVRSGNGLNKQETGEGRDIDMAGKKGKNQAQEERVGRLFHNWVKRHNFTEFCNNPIVGAYICIFIHINELKTLNNKKQVQDFTVVQIHNYLIPGDTNTRAGS